MKFATVISLCFFMIIMLSHCHHNEDESEEKTSEWMIDPNTGLVIDQGMNLVVINCNPCHSSQTIIQNRASREGWKNLINWMQKEQKLWDLKEFEDPILDYLEKHYSPEESISRRKILSNIEWYELSD